MKYVKFGLILLSVLSVSGCAEKTTNSEAPTDFLGSLTASISDGFNTIPETILKYTGGSGDSEELANVKQQLAQTQQRMQVLLQANEKHVQSLQSERVKLQQEKDTLDLAMRQLKHLKRQLANQDGLLMELQKVLSAAEINVAALSSNGKGVSGKKAQQTSGALRQAPNSKVKQSTATQTAAGTVHAPKAAQNLQQQKAQQQKQMQQLRQRQAEQQKKLQQARMLQQQKQKQAQQARIRQQQAAQRIKLQQQQAAQQAKMQQQAAQNDVGANNNQLQALLQQRKLKQQAMQRLNKTPTPKKLESLTLPN